MKFLILFFLMIPFIGTSQIKPLKSSHDFGDLYANAPTYYDFKFTNHSGAPVFLLTVDKPKDVNYIFSKKLIKPDSTMLLRLQVSDRTKGRFNHIIDVYFSDSNTPTTLKLSGNIKERSANSLTECPDFSKTPPNGGMAEFEITIKVIDSLTHEPIKKSKVYVVNNGSLLGEYYTNNDGIIHRKFPIGFYYITAHHQDYLSNFK